MNTRASVIRITKKVSLPYKLSPYYFYLQEKKVKIDTEHVCTLTQQQKLNDIVKEVVDSGVFIKLRRKWRALFMVNKGHPYTPLLFKSMAAIRQEEIRHLVVYPRLIHPFSMFALYWDFFYALILLAFVVGVLPFDMGLINPRLSVKCCKAALDLFTLFDIIINFNRGYLNMTTVKVDLKPRKIITHYLKTYFFWDLASCVPSMLIYPTLNWKKNTGVYQIKWLSVLKFIRVHTMELAVEKFRLYFALSSTIELVCTLFIRCYVILAFCWSIMYFNVQWEYNIKKSIDDDKDFDLLLGTLFSTVIMVMGSSSSKRGLSLGDHISIRVIMLVGELTSLWLFCRMYVLWQRFSACSEMSEDLHQQLQSFMKYKALPVKLRNELTFYFDFRFQKQFFNDHKIMQMFSHNLALEIPRFELNSCIQEVEFLRILPKHVLNMVVATAQIRYFLPGDIIFKPRENAASMFFVRIGSTALFDDKGWEVCHLEDGKIYGACAAVLGENRKATLIAVSACEIFVIKKSGLMNALEAFPDLKQYVIDTAMIKQEDEQSRSFIY